MNNNETIKFYKRNLPHWLVANKSYFVTIRLNGSLPKSFIEQLKKQKELLENRFTSAKSALILKREYFRQIENYLDNNSPAKSDLIKPQIAKVIFENLNWFRTRGWMIYAATIMSNHLHLLMTNTEGKTVNLLKDLGQFKNYTARTINKILDRKGSFWAREDFDHWIRSNDKFERVINYIAKNPVKANYVKKWNEWQWTLIDDSVRDCIKE